MRRKGLSVFSRFPHINKNWKDFIEKYRFKEKVKARSKCRWKCWFEFFESKKLDKQGNIMWMGSFLRFTFLKTRTFDVGKFVFTESNRNGRGKIWSTLSGVKQLDQDKQVLILIRQYWESMCITSACLSNYYNVKWLQFIEEHFPQMFLAVHEGVSSKIID